jgi:hypothetical protein
VNNSNASSGIPGWFPAQTAQHHRIPKAKSTNIALKYALHSEREEYKGVRQATPESFSLSLFFKSS